MRGTVRGNLPQLQTWVAQLPDLFQSRVALLLYDPHPLDVRWLQTFSSHGYAVEQSSTLALNVVVEIAGGFCRRRPGRACVA